MGDPAGLTLSYTRVGGGGAESGRADLIIVNNFVDVQPIVAKFRDFHKMYWILNN